MRPTVAAFVPFEPGHFDATEVLVVGLGSRPVAVVDDMRSTSLQTSCRARFFVARLNSPHRLTRTTPDFTRNKFRARFDSSTRRSGAGHAGAAHPLRSEERRVGE